MLGGEGWRVAFWMSLVGNAGLVCLCLGLGCEVGITDRFIFGLERLGPGLYRTRVVVG